MSAQWPSARQSSTRAATLAVSMDTRHTVCSTSPAQLSRPLSARTSRSAWLYAATPQPSDTCGVTQILVSLN